MSSAGLRSTGAPMRSRRSAKCKRWPSIDLMLPALVCGTVAPLVAADWLDEPHSTPTSTTNSTPRAMNPIGWTTLASAPSAKSGYVRTLLDAVRIIAVVDLASHRFSWLREQLFFASAAGKWTMLLRTAALRRCTTCPQVCSALAGPTLLYCTVRPYFKGVSQASNPHNAENSRLSRILL